MREISIGKRVLGVEYREKGVRGGEEGIEEGKKCVSRCWNIRDNENMSDLRVEH